MEAPTLSVPGGGDHAPRFDADKQLCAIDYVPPPIGVVVTPGSMPAVPPRALERLGDPISPPLAPAAAIRGARGPPCDHA
ncbi:MAG TPA: hypothetical protein VML75_16450 [Kofleriaceae bacterium]|nr:hypothetical protein [Kofleriaceae bacterium]